MVMQPPYRRYAQNTQTNVIIKAVCQYDTTSVPNERSVAKLSFIGPPGSRDRGATWAEYAVTLIGAVWHW